MFPKKAPFPPWLTLLQPRCCKGTGAILPATWGIQGQILAVGVAEQVPADRLKLLQPDWASPAPGFVGSVGMCPGKFHLGAGGLQQNWHWPGNPCGCSEQDCSWGCWRCPGWLGPPLSLLWPVVCPWVHRVHGHSSPSPPLPQQCPSWSCWLLVMPDM